MLCKGVIFFKDCIIYLKESKKKLEINCGEEGIKIFIRDAYKKHVVSSNDASTYCMGTNSSKCFNINPEFLKESSFL